MPWARNDDLGCPFITSGPYGIFGKIGYLILENAHLRKIL